MADVFAQAPAAIALLRGPDHVFELANERFLAVTGARECVGLPIRVALPELEAQGYLEILDAVYRTGQAHRESAASISLPRTARGDEAKAYFDFVYQPVTTGGEGTDAIVVVAVDVTDLVRAREEAAGTAAILGAQKQVLERIVTGDALPVVLETLVKTIESMSADTVLGSILLLDADGVHLRHGAAPSLPAFYNQAIDGVEIGPAVGSCGTAAYRRAQVIVTDIGTDPLWDNFRDLAFEAGLHACWSTPIVTADDRLLGTFAMYYPHPREPEASDLALIDLLVRTAAVAIERCRADEARDVALAREREARADLNFILDVTTKVASTLDYEATLVQLAELAVPALADICLIDLLEDGTLRRAAAAAAPHDRDVINDLRRFPPAADGNHPAATVIATGTVQYGAELSDEFLRETTRDDAHYEAVRALGFRSYMSVPLAARGTTFGALTLVAASSGRRYHARDVALASDLASRAALVIDNIRLYQATRDAERRLSLVAQAGAALTSSLDLDSVLERLCGLLVPGVGDVCEVWVEQRDTTLLRCGTGEERPWTMEHATALPPRVRETVTRGGVATLTDIPPEAVTDVLGGGLAPHGLTRVTIVPLVARGEPIGALTVGTTRHDGAPVDLSVVAVLAGRAALAIDNARMFGAERNAAETLQRSLLPQRLPVIPGMTSAARYRPGGPGVDVGGDWYDVLPFPDGRVGIVIGDVMGRGVVAASVMGQLRNALRGFSLQGLEPAQALVLLDQLLQTDDDCALATIFYGVLDPSSCTLTLGNAGHTPPLLLHAPAEPRWVDEHRDPPLGVTVRGRYRQAVVDLEPGTTIVLYTDGLVERRGQHLDDGLAALAAAARDAPANASPDELCDHLTAVMSADEHDADDSAILVVTLSC